MMVLNLCKKVIHLLLKQNLLRLKFIVLLFCLTFFNSCLLFDYFENPDEFEFNGDFNERFTIEFKTMPSDEMFDEIDKMIETGKTGWHKEGNDYVFNCMWGNGFKAPKGEDENEDRIFGITLTRGKKQGTIRHGAW